MDLLTDSETRDFSRFLDSFASSSSSPLAPPSASSASSSFAAPVPPAPPQAVGSSSRRSLAHGGAATWDLGGWSDGPAPAHAHPPFALPGPPPPPPPLLSHRSSSGSTVPIAQRPHGYLTALPAAPPPPPPASLSWDSHQPGTAGADAQKRARMAQHARDLEAWMVHGGRPPVRTEGYGGEEGERAHGEELGGHPLKRSRSDERPATRPRTKGTEDPLVLMLEEAERRAGWPGTSPGGGMAGGGVGEGFAPPPPPRAQEQALFHAAHVAAAAEEELARSGEAPVPAAVLPAKRKPAPAAPPTKKKRAALDAVRGVAPTVASPSTLVSPAIPAPRAAKPALKPKVEDTAMEEDDAPHENPAPVATPANIPRLPARPRTLLGRARATSTPSEATPAHPAVAAKGSLLTAEQKKANHIASEQKRRAAIRAGYDGLCEVVPALRAAVQEFEERVRRVTTTGPDGKVVVPAVPAEGPRRRAGRGMDGQSTTGALMGGIQVGGEKIDGRAGPKSEAVVLGKTVEHLRGLLEQRSSLLTRLSDAYSTGAARGVQLAPAPGTYGSEWDEKWDESMRGEVLGGGSGSGEGGEVKAEDAQEGDEDAEWEAE